MASAKQTATVNDSTTTATRRSQPVRQTRSNRTATATSKSTHGQPVDIFPAITHFSDAITALPKELVRHFTLLKEVDAKIFHPEQALFQLIDTALNASYPPSVLATMDTFQSAPISIPTLPSLSRCTNGASNYNGHNANASLQRRQLFRQTALKIQEMLVSLEEKNHVISTANEALGQQLARIEQLWPHLESEFSDEAKWGSTTHWAYPENRAARANNTQADRARREGATAPSSAAHQAANEATATASKGADRKQATAAARRAAKTQVAQTHNNHAHTYGAENGNDGKPDALPPPSKKGGGGGKSRKPAVATTTTAVATAGSTTSSSGSAMLSSAATQYNGNPPAKRRKVESTAKGNGNAPTTPSERAMSTALGSSGASKQRKAASPLVTPVPEPAGKKRKALPTSSSQAKRSRISAMSPPAITSPAAGGPVEALHPTQPSLSPATTSSRPATSRGRRNSTQKQSAAESTTKQRPSSSVENNRSNGFTVPSPVDVNSHATGSGSRNGASKNGGGIETRSPKDTAVPLAPPPKGDVVRNENAALATTATAVSNGHSKNVSSKATSTLDEQHEGKRASGVASGPAALGVMVTTTTTAKSGRASKPSTPAVNTFAEALAGGARPRHSKASDTHPVGTTGSAPAKRSHKKGASAALQAAQVEAARLAAAAAATSTEDSGISRTLSGDSTTTSTAAAINNVKERDSTKLHDRTKEKAKDNKANMMQARQGLAILMDVDGDMGENGEDEDEPRYCYCNGVSYGEMVGCDADGCPREWFHLECVGLKVAPKGNAKWYCDDCKEAMRSSSKVNGR